MEPLLHSSCNCTGFRFCAKCNDSSRVKQIFSGHVPLSDAQVVIAKQTEAERLSSCSFAVIGSSKFSLCIECMMVYPVEYLLPSCDKHNDIEASSLRIDGLHVFKDILTREEEQRIIHFLDNPQPFPEWKESQSGRRKQDFGPRRNFKKRKVKPAEIPAMPKAFQPVLAVIVSKTEQCTCQSYQVAEISALEYTEGNLSNFDPHVDDTWLWGNRIAGLNLNSNCAMTFVNSDGNCCDVCFPQRSFFLMTGACRYNWMHGIRPESVCGRRISLTFRELSDTLLQDKEASQMVLSAATTFV